MKKSDKFEWNDEAEAAFEELKALLSTQPVLAAPVSKEPLLLYKRLEDGEEPALQCRRQLCAGLIVIEAWFGGY